MKNDFIGKIERFAAMLVGVALGVGMLAGAVAAVVAVIRWVL